MPCTIGAVRSGKILRHARTSLKLSQSAFVKIASVERTYISLIECGVYQFGGQNATLTHLARSIQDILGYRAACTFLLGYGLAPEAATPAILHWSPRLDLEVIRALAAATPEQQRDAVMRIRAYIAEYKRKTRPAFGPLKRTGLTPRTSGDGAAHTGAGRTAEAAVGMAARGSISDDHITGSRIPV